MAITKDQIDNISFSVNRKGYNIEEVDLFLEKVSNEVENMTKHISELQNQVNNHNVANIQANSENLKKLEQEIQNKNREIESLKAQVENHSNDSKAISEALIVAQRSADMIIKDANDKGDSVVKSAENKARNIRQEAQNSKNKIDADIKNLEEKYKTTKKEYVEMLQEISDKIKNSIKEINDKKKPSHSKDKNNKTDAQVQESSAAKTASSMPIKPEIVSNKTGEIKPTVQKDFSGFGDADFDDGKLE